MGNQRLGQGTQGGYSPDLRVWGQSNMILEMETKRSFNPEGLHLEADMDFKRIHKPPPNFHQLYKICHIYVYMPHFSNLALLTFGPDNSLLWGPSICCRMFSSILILHPLDASGTSPCQLRQPEMLPNIAKCSLGGRGQVTPTGICWFS